MSSFMISMMKHQLENCHVFSEGIMQDKETSRFKVLCAMGNESISRLIRSGSRRRVP